jgi:AhpD family alkylhydroperoxidase
MTITSAPHLRLSVARDAQGSYKAMGAFSGSVELDSKLRHLVDLRASQINGCAFCIDMHTREARAEGETERRLYAVAAWRESPLFSERERAAFAFTEAMTLIATDGVPDDVYEAAAQQFSTSELAQLMMAIAAINSWNRLMVASGAVYEAPEDRD